MIKNQSKELIAELRRARRFDVNFQISVRLEFKVIDLSEAGMRLSSLRPLKVGERFYLPLNLTGLKKPVHCEVVWCRQVKTGFSREHQIGIKFVDYSAAEQIAIRHYLQMLTGKE